MGASVAVIGAGWSGLAAAVRLAQAGVRVTLFEMARHAGGRARSLEGGPPHDNGQHILIGAYTSTLALMRDVGVEVEKVLVRLPLTLRYPDGRGLQAARTGSRAAIAAALARGRGWTWRDRGSLAWHALRWKASGFECDPSLTVEALCRDLSPRVRELMIDPLCVAALNTPARDASAAVMLRVLRDALFGPAGSSDLLLPGRPLGELLPHPALDWLSATGCEVLLGRRVSSVDGSSHGWRVDSEPFDGVVLATSAAEAARLTAALAPSWAQQAAAFRYEPIVTVTLRGPGASLPAPMTALLESPSAPAQFAFDHGQLGGEPGLITCVVSGAAGWVDRGLDATGNAVRDQLVDAFRTRNWAPDLRVCAVVAEKRATFRCVPGLDRPRAAVAHGLFAAGDFIEGPYPATLEGAVRSGEHAAAELRRQLGG